MTAGSPSAAPSAGGRPGSGRAGLGGRAAGASGAFVARVAGVGLFFGLQLVLARALGAGAFGVVAALTAWIAVLSVPARMGADYSMVRFLASYIGADDRPRCRTFHRVEVRRVVLVSAAVAGAFGVVAVLIASYRPGLSIGAALAATATIPLLALVRVEEAAVKGGGQAALSFVPYWIVVPGAGILGILAARLLGGPDLSASGAITVQLLATASALVIGAALVARRLRSVSDRGATPVTSADHALWRRSFWRLGLYNVVSTVMTQSDVLVVAVVLGATAAGPYSVAARTATLLSFFLLAANAVVGPRSALLFHQGRLPEIESELQRTVLVVSVLSALGWLALLGGGRLVLGLFGARFADAAYVPLLILGIGQVVNSCTGPVVLLLNMTGLEAVAVRALASGAFLGLVLQVGLGLWLGATGVAIGSALVVCAVNSYLVHEVRSRLDLRVLPSLATVGAVLRRTGSSVA